MKTLLIAIVLAASLAGSAVRAQVSPAPSPAGDASGARDVRRALPVAAGSPGAAESTPAAPATATPSSAPASDAVQNTNVLAPDDVVTVKVFEEDDLETSARISRDGLLTFPLIGAISIAGKTPDDAARAIADELKKKFLVNPQVTLTVTEYARRSFTVLGEVQKPGSYDMPNLKGVTLLEAIGAAGGYTRIADASKIRLKRVRAGKETVYKLNAKSMASERETATFQIQPGDIITVGESFF
jgi:protein involved in polysaccharide export with SLBB domain